MESLEVGDFLIWLFCRRQTKCLIACHPLLRPRVERCLGFAPRSQSFAFWALPKLAQSVRYPDLQLRCIVRPQIRHRSLLRSKAWFCPSQARLFASKACFVASLGLSKCFEAAFNSFFNNFGYCIFFV